MAGAFRKLGEFIGLTSRDDEDDREEEYYDEEPQGRFAAQAAQETQQARASANNNVRAFRDSTQSRAQAGYAGGTRGATPTSDTNVTHQTVLMSLESFDETNKVINELLAAKSVLVNMDKAEPRERQRMVDSLSGATYALRAKLRKVADNTYYIAPQGIGVQGEIKMNIPETDPALREEPEELGGHSSIFRRGRVDE